MSVKNIDVIIGYMTEKIHMSVKSIYAKGTFPHRVVSECELILILH